MFELHASAAAAWLDCAKRANYLSNRIDDEDEPERGRSVALEIGHRVHHRITGHSYDETPNIIRYDKATRSKSEMERQVELLSKLAGEKLETEGLAVKEKELPMALEVSIADNPILLKGTADLICEREGKTILIDLKTGKNPPKTVWVQLSIYLYLYRQLGLGEVEACGVLAVPRKCADIVECSYEERPAEALSGIVEPLFKHIVRSSLAGGLPNPSSIFCHSCRADCAFAASRV